MGAGEYKCVCVCTHKYIRIYTHTHTYTYSGQLGSLGLFEVHSRLQIIHIRSQDSGKELDSCQVSVSLCAGQSRRAGSDEQRLTIAEMFEDFLT